MAGILISPKADIQIRNRNAAYRRKHGIPDFRDILRQRCRERIKTRRSTLVNRLRFLNSEDEVRSALSDMMRSDVNDISANKSCILESETESMDCTTPFKPAVDSLAQLELENEFTEEERYIMEMYEQLLESEQAMVDSLLEDEIICPLCEKGIFKNNQGILQCSLCPATLRSTASPSHIKHLIFSGLSTHNQFCSEKANFAVFSEDAISGLFLICDSCAYFVQIV